VAVLATGAVGLAACGSGFKSGSSNDSDNSSSNNNPLNVMIGSSTDAEGNAVKEAAAKFTTQSGIKVNINTANNLVQQLSQGFTSGKPADAFYLGNDTFPAFAKNGSLDPFGSKLKNVDDFYDSIKKSFTYNGKLYAAPKDFSTLALIINQESWTKAGLTDADTPKTWDQLAAVAKKLTNAQQVGLSISPEFARVGVFMAQAGGWLVSSDDKTVTANSSQNVQALTYVKKLLSDGSLKFSSQVGAGWGGEAFGKGKSAMTIEGNWIVGAIQHDYPTVKYKVAELPAGPAGKGTMQFNGGWGIAADSKNKANAQKFVEFMTATDQQMGFAKAFGVMPSVKSAADQWKQAYPEQAPFLAGADYAKSIPNIVGIADVVKDFNSQIEGLTNSDPKQVLDSVQKNLEATVGK
jgi:multiple sugar transport system substrate-binding protein